MTGSSFDATVGSERAEIQRLAKANPGVAFVGHVTGQLALHLDPPVEGVSRASITATTLPPIPGESAPYYHAAVHRTTDSGTGLPDCEVYRHPFPALDWLAETVPDFDLIETTYVNEPAEGGPATD